MHIHTFECFKIHICMIYEIKWYRYNLKYVLIELLKFLIHHMIKKCAEIFKTKNSEKFKQKIWNLRKNKTGKSENRYQPVKTDRTNHTVRGVLKRATWSYSVCEDKLKTSCDNEDESDLNPLCLSLHSLPPHRSQEAESQTIMTNKTTHPSSSSSPSPGPEKQTQTLVSYQTASTPHLHHYKTLNVKQTSLCKHQQTHTPLFKTNWIKSPCFQTSLTLWATY